MKTKSATIALFFSPPYLLLVLPFSPFFFPFPSLPWFWRISGLRNVPFDAFSHKWLQISLGWFSKNRLDVSKEFCQSVKVCHFDVADGVSGHLASMLLTSLDHLAEFLITLSPNRPFASNSFFRPKTIPKVAILKTKSAIIAFFSSPPFLLLALSFSSFPFPSLLWIWSFSGVRNVPFDAFSLKWPQISLRWFSKNRLDVCMYVYHRICLDFKYGPRNRGSFVRSQSIQKENKKTLRPQLKCDVKNLKPGRIPVSYRKLRFCKRKVRM